MIPESVPYFSDDKMHRYVMQYLKVHGKDARYGFDERLFDVIEESARQADLIQILEESLLEARASN